MRKLAGFFAALAALALAFRFGGGAQDVSELVPVQALVIDAQNGEITVTADTQDVGRGEVSTRRFPILRAGCAGDAVHADGGACGSDAEGVVFDAAGVRERATSPGGKTIPRGGTKHFSGAGAFVFTGASGELTLSRARAALLENKEVQAAVLVQTGGGFRLGG